MRVICLQDTAITNPQAENMLFSKYIFGMPQAKRKTVLLLRRTDFSFLWRSWEDGWRAQSSSAHFKEHSLRERLQLPSMRLCYRMGCSCQVNLNTKHVTQFQPLMYPIFVCDMKRGVEVHTPPQTLEETLDSIYLYTTRRKRTKFKGLAKLPSWLQHTVWYKLSKLFAHSFLPADHLLHSNTLCFWELW